MQGQKRMKEEEMNTVMCVQRTCDPPQCQHLEPFATQKKCWMIGLFELKKEHEVNNQQTRYHIPY
jgi:hypothetical protein